MMRCLHCSRDYPEGYAFCHQCGEALQACEPSGERSPVHGRPAASAPRARAMARRRAPGRSQSLVFAMVVVLGAITGLAVVTRQTWMPSRASVATKPSGPENPPPAAAAAPPPEPVEAQSPPPVPAPPPVLERVTAAATPPPATRAPEPAPVPTPAPAAKRAPDLPSTPSPKTATRPDASSPTERPAGGAAGSPATTAPKLLSARTDPASAIPAAGARVVSLVAVGSAPRARGQLLWEPLGGGTLVVSGLPQPPAGRTYQLWLGSIDLGSRVSAGLLAVDAQGAGTLRVAPLRSTWSPDIFGVTVERQGGAREPSDNLVLVGEMPKLSAAAPTAPNPSPPAEAPAAGAPAPEATPAPAPAAPTTASLPSPVSRGPDGQFVRVFPATQERSWLVAQSVLKSLGWDIDSADQTTGIIRTEPRNVTFKDFVVYAEGTRHVVSVVVRSVSSGETSISVRRDVFEEQRIFWAKERKLLPTPESTVELKILDAIERVL